MRLVKLPGVRQIEAFRGMAVVAVFVVFSAVLRIRGRIARGKHYQGD
jgi:hypothetical protein